LVQRRAAGILLDQFDPFAALVVRYAAARALRAVRVAGLGPLVALLRTVGEACDAIGRLGISAAAKASSPTASVAAETMGCRIVILLG